MELKNCPFCDGVALLQKETKYGYGEAMDYYSVGCSICKTKTRSESVMYGTNKAVKEVCDIWNKRV